MNLLLILLGVIGSSVLILSLVAYIVFFHGQMTRPKLEELFGIDVAVKENDTSIQQIAQDTFLVGEEFGLGDRKILFFSSNDRFELAVGSAKTLSRYLKTPVFLCNHYGYPTEVGYWFLPRTNFARLKTGALRSVEAVETFANGSSSLSTTKRGTGIKGAVVVGQSLGSIPASHVASNRNDLTRLLLISPFTQSDEILRNPLPKGLKGLVNLAIFRPRADIRDSLFRFSGKLRIIIPEDDNLVPTASQKRLADHFCLEQSDVTLMPGRGHFGLMGEEAFMKQLSSAFDGLYSS